MQPLDAAATIGLASCAWAQLLVSKCKQWQSQGACRGVFFFLVCPVQHRAAANAICDMYRLLLLLLAAV